MDDVEIRARLSKLERTVQFLLDALHLEFVDDLSGQFPEVLALKRQGKDIEAIKRYREITGVGLREAKEFVEKL